MLLQTSKGEHTHKPYSTPKIELPTISIRSNIREVKINVHIRNLLLQRSSDLGKEKRKIKATKMTRTKMIITGRQTMMKMLCKIFTLTGFLLPRTT